MSLGDKIRKIVVEVLAARDFVETEIAKVESVNPLTIRVSDRLLLTEDFLILTETVVAYQLDLSHVHTTTGDDTGLALGLVDIRSGLVEEDNVAIQKVQGGQFYLVIDKVVT